jgi:hypothetical protein
MGGEQNVPAPAGNIFHSQNCNFPDEGFILSTGSSCNSVHNQVPPPTEWTECCRLFFSSSELGLPTPSHAGECAVCTPSPLVPGERLAGEGVWGSPNLEEGTDTVVLKVYTRMYLVSSSQLQKWGQALQSFHFVSLNFANFV